MPENPELSRFAEKVRRDCLDIMAAAEVAGAKKAAALAALLCTEAATVVQQAKMQEEVSEPDRYDLSALPPPSETENEE